jgi:hypothetical protein
MQEKHEANKSDFGAVALVCAIALLIVSVGAAIWAFRAIFEVAAWTGSLLI